MYAKIIFFSVLCTTLILAEYSNSSVVKDGPVLTPVELQELRSSDLSGTRDEDKEELKAAIEKALVQKDGEVLEQENDDSEEEEEELDNIDVETDGSGNESSGENYTQIVTPVSSLAPTVLRSGRLVPEMKSEFVEVRSNETKMDGYELSTEDLDSNKVHNFGEKYESVANSTDIPEPIEVKNFWNRAADKIHNFIEEKRSVYFHIFWISVLAVLIMCLAITHWILRVRRRNRAIALEKFNAELYATSTYSHRFEKITLPENEEVTMQLMSAENSLCA